MSPYGNSSRSLDFLYEILILKKSQGGNVTCVSTFQACVLVKFNEDSVYNFGKEMLDDV